MGTDTVTKLPTIVPGNYDWSKGVRKVATLKGHANSIQSVAFSPDGRYALTGSWDYTAKLWSVPSGVIVKTLTGHKDCITSVTFSPDGRYALTGSWDDTAKQWSVPDGAYVKTLNLSGCVTDAKFSPDGRYILCGNGRDMTSKEFVLPPEGRVATLFECVS